jgi:pimeloyl-ACP methyl ester carboxylesterase
MFWLAHILFHARRFPHRKTPADHDIPFEEIKIPAIDGGSLYGWWLPAGNEGAPVIIFTHGWNSNMSHHLSYLRKLHGVGYNVLAFDARGHGLSSDLRSPTVWTFTQDILAALGWLRASGKGAGESVGAVGHSLGGSAAVNAASQDESICAVLAVGAFAHPIQVMSHDMRKRHIPVFPIGWLFFTFFRLFYHIDFDRIAPMNNISKAQAHILLVHGEEDEQVPISQAETLRKAGDPERTRLMRLVGRGHNNCHHHPDFWPTVLSFYEENLP